MTLRQRRSTLDAQIRRVARKAALQSVDKESEKLVFIREYYDHWEVGVLLPHDYVEHVTTFSGPNVEKDAKEFYDKELST